MPIVEARGLSKCFRIYRRPSDHLLEVISRRNFHEEFWAVQDVNVAVDRGCCLGIIGENGSGKSTLLTMLAGVVRPTSGEIVVTGRVSALLELGAGFDPQFTGRENIFVNAAILGFSRHQTIERLPDIEKFAEIGDFIDRPVKTYSSGMFVRLAFAVAIHLDPDVLIIDEALSVGDYLFQQRCIRRIMELKHQGVTIIFVSHDLEAVRVLADFVMWLERGRVKLEGETEEVVGKYVASLVGRGRKEGLIEGPIGTPIPGGSNDLELSEGVFEKIPVFISSIPNVDHRFGNGNARIEGIGIFNSTGDPVTTAMQGDRICVRISVEFFKEVLQPNVGFMLRNRLGQDVTGTNVMFEGQRLEEAKAGDRLSVDFVMDLPFLHSGFYCLSPAVADGELDRYEVCDWIDNACAIELVERNTTYGHLRIPIRVRAVWAQKLESLK